MRHIHSDKTNVYTLHIVTGKIKRTFEDICENQDVFLLLNYGVMLYKESKVDKLVARNPLDFILLTS